MPARDWSLTEPHRDRPPTARNAAAHAQTWWRRLVSFFGTLVVWQCPSWSSFRCCSEDLLNTCTSVVDGLRGVAGPFGKRIVDRMVVGKLNRLDAFRLPQRRGLFRLFVDGINVMEIEEAV